MPLTVPHHKKMSRQGNKTFFNGSNVQPNINQNNDQKIIS